MPQVIELTKEQYEQMLQSGQISLTPPTQSNPKGPGAKPNVKELFKTLEEPKQAQAKPKAQTQPQAANTLPSLPKNLNLVPIRPARQMDKYYKKKYDTKILKLSDLAGKIQDPRLRKKAFRSLDASGAGSVIDISNNITALYNLDKKFQNQAKQTQKINGKIETTRDMKKAKQKYSEITGEAGALLDNIKYLTDNFDDDYAGYLDTKLHNLGRTLNIGDTKQEAYKQRNDQILLSYKNLQKMGANFTKGEQYMIKNVIPDIESGDKFYRQRLYSFTQLARDTIKRKLESLKKGNYDTGKLEEIASEYDKALEIMKKRFGEDFSQNNKQYSTGYNKTKQTSQQPNKPNQPKGFKSELKQSQTTTQTNKKVFTKDNINELNSILGL